MNYLASVEAVNLSKINTLTIATELRYHKYNQVAFMKVAFVGKGGSGKTTISTLFVDYTVKNSSEHVWAIDADLNMHLADQLGLQEEVRALRHISFPESEKDIKSYLIGNNSKIQSISHFKKSSPPTKASNFIVPFKKDDYILQNFSVNRDNLYLSIVGSYHSEGIGASCYHNNLAVFESMLSHTIDLKSTVVVDMVAGTDAFAGTLHAQFDMIVIVVEPTKKSIEVYDQYKTLALEADIWELAFVVGNKVMSNKDQDFIQNHIEEDKLLGYVSHSEHIKEIEQEDGILDINLLEERNVQVFEKILFTLKQQNISFNSRLQRLYKLHNRYVAQGYIKDRLGDLNVQVDITFNFDEFVKQYE